MNEETHIRTDKDTRRRLPAPCSAEYAVEWNGGEGWKRLAQTKPTEKEAREYAEWVLVKDHQMYRIIEITEKILPDADIKGGG